MKKIVLILCCLFTPLLVSSGWATEPDPSPMISEITPKRIAQGGVLTITGRNLTKKVAQTTVKIDGKEVPYKIDKDEPEGKITVTVNTKPQPGQSKPLGNMSGLWLSASMVVTRIPLRFIS